MSKFCTNCGNMMADSDRFCKKCGTKSIFEVPQTPVQPPVQQPVQTPIINEIPVAPVVPEQPATPTETPVAAPVTPVIPSEPIAPIAPVIPEQPIAPIDTPAAAPAAPVPVYIPAQPVAETPKKKKGKKGLIITLSVIIVALIAIGCALFFLLPPILDGDCTEALDLQVDLLFGEGDIDNLAPEECWEAVEEYGMDKESFSENIEMLSEEMFEQFGDDISITYTVLKKERFDKDDLDDLKEEYDELFDIDPKRISAAYEIEYELKIKGSEKSDTVEDEIVVLKIDGKWYPYFDLQLDA